MQNSYVTEFQRLGSSDRRALFVSPPPISSDMTDAELAAALRLRARTATTAQANRLLAAAASFERPVRRPIARRDAGKRTVDFKVNGRGIHERRPHEMRRGLGLAGL